jgi:hypothetical protein
MKLINTIKKIVEEKAPSLQFRRRLEVFDKLLKIVMESSYVCDYESEEHFLNAIYEEFQFSYDRFLERTGIDRDSVLSYLKNQGKNSIYEYYRLKKQDCL